MQEVFEEFAQLVANGDSRAQQILQEIYDQKRAGNIRKMSRTDADSIYDVPLLMEQEKLDRVALRKLGVETRNIDLGGADVDTINKAITDFNEKEGKVPKEAPKYGDVGGLIENAPKENDLDFEKELIKVLKLHNVELICLAGFMQILSKNFIKNFKNRILNIHPSLLPKYKGLNTHARVLASKDTVAGCSVHLVTEEMDGGPVLAQTKVKIKANETVESLTSRVLIEEHLLYPRVLLNFSNQIRKSIQEKNCK